LGVDHEDDDLRRYRKRYLKFIMVIYRGSPRFSYSITIDTR